VLSRVLKKILQLLLRRLSSPNTAKSRMVAKSGIRAEFHGVMVTVHCESFSGQNGLDLARRVDEIVAAFDQPGDRNLTDFHSKGYMLTAHMP
jgi:hypothetical protein